MRAAVLEQIGQPLKIMHITIPNELQPGQVLVRVLCAGICGSQLQEIDGLKGDPAHLPHMLGHEGCGIVEAVDNVVTTVKPGDKVVLHWRKGEGCDVLGMQGAVKAGPITTFSDFTFVSENRVTAIPQDIPNDFAALLGCALSTAVSIVENEAKPKIGDVISVIGCGGLGLSIIFALTMRKSELWKVYGIDPIKSKKELVEQFHLAKFVLGIPSTPVSDLVIDTVGNRPMGNRYISLQKNGTSAGGFNPVKDIPRYCEMFRHGTFDGYEKIITHRIALDQINEGIQLMREGKAGRVMIEFP